jgi:hypothetical protein
MLEVNKNTRGIDLVVKTVFPLSPNGRCETSTYGVISNSSLEQPYNSTQVMNKIQHEVFVCVILESICTQIVLQSVI